VTPEAVRTLSMTDVWPIAAAIVSIILAILAIGLSVWFFKESVRYSQEGARAADSISASVKKLETLFDRLYTDTFSMMRDTYADMRKHVWPSTEEDEVQDETDQKAAQTVVEALRDQVVNTMAEIIKRQSKSQEDIDQIKQNINTKESIQLTRAIRNTVEAIEKPTPTPPAVRARRLIRIFLTREARKGRMSVPAEEIVDKMSTYNIHFPDAIDALDELHRRNLVLWEGSIGPSTHVRLPDDEQPATRDKG
jgi:predicted transcriptional regulator